MFLAILVGTLGLIALIGVTIVLRRRHGFVVPVLRNHVSFAAADPVARTWRGVQVLEDFANYLRRRPVQYRMTPIVQDGDGAHFSICWLGDDFHRVVVRSIRAVAVDRPWSSCDSLSSEGVGRRR